MRRTGGVLAAYLIVLQAVLAGLALGAAPALADPLSVFCHTVASDQAPASDPEHKALPNCCVAGCALHIVGTPPPAGYPAPVGDPFVANGSPILPPALAPPSEDHTPRNPRAPPVQG